MSTPENGLAQSDVVAIEWVVELIDGLQPLSDARPTLNFSADGRLSGSSTCNRYTTSYTIHGSRITLQAIATTRRACPPELMDQEQKFLEVLGGAVHVTLSDTAALIITDHQERQILSSPRQSSQDSGQISI